MKLMFRSSVVLAAILFGLVILQQIKIEMDCVVCESPTYAQSVLCWIAAGFDETFLHFQCISEYKKTDCVRKGD